MSKREVHVCEKCGKSYNSQEYAEACCEEPEPLMCDDCGATFPDNEIGRTGYWSHCCQ